jgi:predicted outer membrane repeat protein
MSRIVLYIAVFSVLLNFTSATVIHVPSEQPTIQDGLNAASENDTVLVAPGAYYENIIWPNTPGIDLRSEAGAESTIIDGDSLGSVIVFNTPQDTSTWVWEFTITHGIAEYGGGVYCDNSGPSIRDCIITENAANRGGGLACIGATPRISGNHVEHNEATQMGGGSYFECTSLDMIFGANFVEHNSSDSCGGGISVSGSTVRFSTNTIRYNSSGLGGGFHFYECEIQDFGCIIENNEARIGAGVYLDSSWVELVSTFIDNVAGEYGGGVAFIRNSDGLIYPTWVEGNSAGNGGGGFYLERSSPEFDGYSYFYMNSAETGGAIYCTDQSSPYIYHIWISYNTATGMGGGIYCTDGSFPTIVESDILFNGVGIYNADSSGVVIAENNFWSDPSGPYHSTANPSGLGDTVSDYVDFEPWSSMPFAVYESPIMHSLDRIKLWVYPNPVKDFAEIQFTVPSDGEITLQVYNILGQEVTTLFNERKGAGLHTTYWKPEGVPSGLYFLCLSIGYMVQMKKNIVLVK